MTATRNRLGVLGAVLILCPLVAAAEGDVFDLPREVPLAPGVGVERGPLRTVVDGDTLVVGVPGAHAGRGLVQVFARHPDQASGWRSMARFRGPGPGDTGFGRALALDGDVLMVGAPLESTGGSSSGAVYLFRRDRGGRDRWGRVRRITAKATGFGSEVAISGRTALVAAAGEVHELDRDRGGPDHWYGALLRPSFALDTPAVAISGDTLAIGTLRPGSDHPRDHHIAIFERDDAAPAGWREIRVLRPPDGVSGRFGAEFVLDGSTLVAPAFGQVYVYERDVGGRGRWGRRRSLDVPDASQPEFQAFDGCRLEPPLALRGNTVVVNTADLNDAGLRFRDCGAELLVFERDQGGRNRWGAVARLERIEPTALNQVTVGPAEVVVGAGELRTFPRLPIAEDDFESGDLRVWTAVEGDVSLVGPGLDGSQGAVEVTLDGSGRAVFIGTNRALREPAFSMSFLMSANRVELGRNSVAVLRLAGGRQHLLLLLAHDRAFRAAGQPAGDHYRMGLWSRQDTGSWQFHGRMFMPPARAVRIELEWRRSTGAGHDNGWIRVLRDGVVRMEAQGLDNDRLSVDGAYLGMPLGLLGEAGDSRGSMLFDDVILER